MNKTFWKRLLVNIPREYSWNYWINQCSQDGENRFFPQLFSLLIGMDVVYFSETYFYFLILLSFERYKIDVFVFWLKYPFNNYHTYRDLDLQIRHKFSYTIFMCLDIFLWRSWASITSIRILQMELVLLFLLLLLLYFSYRYRIRRYNVKVSVFWTPRDANTKNLLARYRK